MKGVICSRSRQTNNSVRVGNEKMNRPIVDQTLSPKKGEALPKRGDADHIVRAYSNYDGFSFNPFIEHDHTLSENLL